MPKREFKPKTGILGTQRAQKQKGNLKAKTGKMPKREFSLKFKTGNLGKREFKAKTGNLGTQRVAKQKMEFK